MGDGLNGRLYCFDVFFATVLLDLVALTDRLAEADRDLLLLVSGFGDLGAVVAAAFALGVEAVPTELTAFGLAGVTDFGAADALA